MDALRQLRWWEREIRPAKNLPAEGDTRRPEIGE
jgi:hypothetical protein